WTPPTCPAENPAASRRRCGRQPGPHRLTCQPGLRAQRTVMAAHPEPARPGALARASSVVDLGLQACEAYGRGDLASRLAAAKRRLADPAVHIVVAGEFKQGKSSLVNALLGANVCPVDDDVATAVPTYVRYGQQPRAELLFTGESPDGGSPGGPAGEPH